MLEEYGFHSHVFEQEGSVWQQTPKKIKDRDRGSDPKLVVWGENSKLLSDPWEQTNKKLGNLVCAVLQSQPVLKINSQP